MVSTLSWDDNERLVRFAGDNCSSISAGEIDSVLSSTCARLFEFDGISISFGSFVDKDTMEISDTGTLD